MTPASRRTDHRQVTERRQREAVLRGLAESVAEQGYGATTVADIARAGRISKSTVYAHFADKEEAFLALYRAAADRVLAAAGQASVAAVAAGMPWRERARVSFLAYFAAVQDGGVLTACLIDALAVGPRARAARREVMTQYTLGFASLAEQALAEEVGVHVPDHVTRLVFVGGTQELMLEAMERSAEWDAKALADAQVALAARLLGLPPD